MNNPFFSIVITCHNYERYVGKCIQSVFDQTFKDFELIVVNAGSTDNSQEVISSFSSILSTTAPSGSHANACNQGFVLCKGKWVLFLDADDFLFCDCLSIVYPLAKKENVKIQYNLSICDSNGLYGKRLMTVFPLIYDSEIIKSSFERTGTYIWPVTSGNIYSFRFLNLVLPLKVNLPPDGQLNTMAPAFGRVAHINQALGCYRLHDHNMDNRSLKPWDSRRFQYNLKRRYREFYHARKTICILKKRMPIRASINYEIHFITYRIFLKKLRVSYFMSKNENLLFLLYLLFIAYLRNFFSIFYFFKSFIWTFSFLLLPKCLAALFMRFRYNQGNFLFRRYFL